MSRKNPFKGAIILTVFAALTVGLYFALKPYFEKDQKAQDNATLLYGGLAREEIYELKLKNVNGTFLIKKSADKTDSWTVSEEVEKAQSFDADAGSVNGVISTILAARKEAKLNNIKAADVGLLPAAYEVHVSHGATGAKVLLLGQDTPVDYLVYAKWADSPDIFLTSRSLRFGVDKKLNEIRNKKVFEFKLADFKEIKWEVARNTFEKFKGVDFTKDEKGTWVASSNKNVPVLGEELQNFLEALNKQSVKDFASEESSKASEFGLNTPDITFTLVPEGKDAAAQVWKLSKQKHTDKDKFQIFQYFLAKQGDDAIYEINASIFDQFNVDLMKFRDNKITELNQSTISEIQVEFPNAEAVTLTKKDNSWQFKSGENWVEAKDDKVKEILAKLNQLRAVEYFDEESPRKLGLDKPLRVVDLSYTQDSAKKNKVLFFGKKLDTALYAVNSEGLPAAASVKLDVESLFPDKTEAYHVEVAKVSKEPAAASSEAAAKKGKKVKMEPTVSSPKDIRKLPAPIVKDGFKYTAKMSLSNGQELEIEFDAKNAPYTVSNFLHLARNKFYDNVVFHRVIADFVVQGGDPTGTGTGGPGYKFDNEDNDVKHLRGSLSMAHAGRNTNGSQFFIVLAPQPHLDGLHTVFGMVTKGKEGLDEITQGTKMTKVEVFEEAL